MNCAIATLCKQAIGFTIIAVTSSQLMAQVPKSPHKHPKNSPAVNQPADDPSAQTNGPHPGKNSPSPKVPEPARLKTKEGKMNGWQVTLPGGRPLATPAVVDGKLFIGGGFGSHEFYAFDARSGKLLWEYHTADDGPTAAVVADGYVGFNTESCELEILTLDGKPVWKKWLGDPLMSAPAIADGKVFMCYPESKGDKQHHLACFALADGKELWKKPIAGEIITAPVIADDRVYLATLEGTMFCFSQLDGTLAWQEKKNATSAPMVGDGQCYFSRREAITAVQSGRQVRQQVECLAAQRREDGIHQ